MLGTVALAVALSLAVLVFLYGLRPLARWRYRHIPGPPPAWLVGNGRTYLSGQRLPAITAAAQKYGKVFKVWNGATPTLIVHDAEVGRLVALRNPVRGDIGGPGQFTFSAERRRRQRRGLFLTQDRNLHKTLKHAWLPSMNSTTLAGNAALMESSAHKLVELLDGPAQAGEAVNIWRRFGDMTLEVVGTAAFGVEFNSQQGTGPPDPQARELVDAVQQVFRFSGNASTVYAQLAIMLPELHTLLTACSLVFPDAALKQWRTAFDNMDKVLKRLVREARAKMTDQGVDIHVTAGASSGAAAGASQEAAPSGDKKPRGIRPGSFPTMMMQTKDPQTGQPLDDITVASQATTFLLAGYETTGTTLGFTTYCLAANPDKLAKLLQEVDSYGAGRELTLEEIFHMPYLEACYKEAMRLFCPVVTLDRKLAEAQVIGGFRIPKGTNVQVPVWSIQRDAEYWPNPEAFLPERWLEGAPEHHPHTPGAWMPFGEGTRICAGQRFALQEIKITLARVLERYTFKLAKGQEALALRASIVLAPETGAINVVPVKRARCR